MQGIFDEPPHIFQEWDSLVFRKAGIEVKVLRGDLFHPWIQGNKWYKLRWFAAKAARENAQGFLSIGGPWSNHLLALAAYAYEKNLFCRFFIRGAEAEWLHHPPIKQLLDWGAELLPLSRTDFRRISNSTAFAEEFDSNSDNLIAVPLGASAPETVRYVAEWSAELQRKWDFSDLVLPAASGGTCAGMQAGLRKKTLVHAIDVLGSKGKLAGTVQHLINASGLKAASRIVWHDGYDFGGYAKNHPSLDKFQQSMVTEFGLPTEHVYSGKAFFAVSDLAEKGVFLRGSKILILHTGGLFPWNSLN